MNSAVFLHSSKQGAVRRGHPWIFPKAILRQTAVVTGELAAVFGEKGEPLGVGIYNEHSLYRVRMLALDFESVDKTSIASLVSYRLNQAVLLRQNVNLPSESTNAFRMFNSEGDGLSGLTIDYFDKVCVASSSAYWVEAHKDTICQCIREAMPSVQLLWLPQVKSLAQDGWLDVKAEDITGTQQISEAGILYQVDFSNTQKTGLFLDQRENHQRIATLAEGMRVLDLYTYTGGFALHAAKAGASAVTAVDSSAQAIALAKRNAQLNQVELIEFIEADARDYLVKAGDYDLIILDPPKLAPSQKHLQRAKNYYRFLHREVIKAMRPGSLLLTCNCSSAISSQEFTELVSSQAMNVNKIVRILGVFGPAICHPTLSAFPEGQYLTAVLLAVV